MPSLLHTLMGEDIRVMYYIPIKAISLFSHCIYLGAHVLKMHRSAALNSACSVADVHRILNW